MSNHESRSSSQAQQQIAPSPSTTFNRVDVKPSDSEVAKLAFAKFEARGRAHGFDREDWAAASRELGNKGPGRDRAAAVSLSR